MYLGYLKALLRHKWFVFLEAWKLGIPWLGLVHDLSKFWPSEFWAYAQYFYGPNPSEDIFNVGWLHHQHRNKHHWQRWILTNDRQGQTICLPMPDKYRREMLADWKGAGRAYGNPNTAEWYLQNRNAIQLHWRTREWIEDKLGISQLPVVAREFVQALTEGYPKDQGSFAIEIE